MSETPTTWTLEGFCEHFQFVHEKMPDHKFVWVLGAGASKASGIHTGGQLVDRWLGELHLRLARKGVPVEQWATAENLDIPKFKYEERASFYPDVYERRFRDYPEEGYACLEDLMAGKDPSPGYSILAKALEDTRHSAVITTNFDNLVADALSIYTDTFPFVCGHELLTSFVRVAMRRPLVCKIHRDLLLGPKSDSRSLKRLHEAWAAALRALLEHYTPIFIGYGGNDGSLMGLLESLEPGEIKGRMIWCYYKEADASEKIQELVVQHRGVLVAAPDFDLLMVLLGQKMGIGLLDDVIIARAKYKARTYRQRVLALNTADYPVVAKALEATMERAGGWWAWELKVRAEPDPARQETIYRQGIAQFSESPELHNNFASFMTDVRKNHDEAERLYQKALELDPNDVRITGNFALFMTDVRKNHDEAERLYRKALKLDPNHANNTGNFANFMTDVRKNHDEAERLYQKALKLDPENATIISNFAAFMTDVRKNHDEAERLFQKALKLDPNHANNTGNFANFMTNVRKNYDEAERLYKKVLELDPENANITGNFGGFLLARGRTEEAAPVLERAETLNRGERDQISAEIALYCGILAKTTGGDDAPVLEQLGTLLDDGFDRLPWSFDDVLEFAQGKLTPEDYALYTALAEAILDADKLPLAVFLLKQHLQTPAAPVKKAGKKKNAKKAARKKKTAKRKGDLKRKKRQ